MLDALEASGAGTRISVSRCPGASLIDREGRVTDERPLRQILTSWDRLQRLLRATIDEARYHLGWNFERVDQDELRACGCNFPAGASSTPTFLSAVTASVPACARKWRRTCSLIYAGYYIWRGAPNEADLAPETLAQHLSRCSRSSCRKQQQVITYPISGFDNDLRPGKRRFNFIWYRVADADTAARHVRGRERRTSTNTRCRRR